VIVMKFGGTSVGSPERIRALAERVRERSERRPVVVVSAFSKVTDLLVRGANLALARDSDYENVVFEILERHHGAINELVPRGPSQERLLAHLDTTITELRALYTGVYHLASSRAHPDAISDRRAPPTIVAAALPRGIPAQGWTRAG
jgi:aspartokinase/homoserine dehydrogenase 1